MIIFPSIVLRSLTSPVLHHLQDFCKTALYPRNTAQVTENHQRLHFLQSLTVYIGLNLTVRTEVEFQQC